MHNLNPALTLWHQFYITMNLPTVLTVVQQHFCKNRRQKKNIRALQYRMELRELGFIIENTVAAKSGQFISFYCGFIAGKEVQAVHCRGKRGKQKVIILIMPQCKAASPEPKPF